MAGKIQKKIIDHLRNGSFTRIELFKRVYKIPASMQRKDIKEAYRSDYHAFYNSVSRLIKQGIIEEVEQNKQKCLRLKKVGIHNIDRFYPEPSPLRGVRVDLNSLKSKEITPLEKIEINESVSLLINQAPRILGSICESSIQYYEKEKRKSIKLLVTFYSLLSGNRILQEEIREHWGLGIESIPQSLLTLHKKSLLGMQSLTSFPEKSKDLFKNALSRITFGNALISHEQWEELLSKNILKVFCLVHHHLPEEILKLMTTKTKQETIDQAVAIFNSFKNIPSLYQSEFKNAAKYKIRLLEKVDFITPFQSLDFA